MVLAIASGRSSTLQTAHHAMACNTQHSANSTTCKAFETPALCKEHTKGTETADLLSDAQVSNANVGVARQVDIGRLQVSVQHAVLVQVLQSRSHKVTQGQQKLQKQLNTGTIKRE